MTLSRELDFETGPRALEMRVMAYTDDTPPRSAEITLNVQVDDVNDNRPTFAQEVSKHFESIISFLSNTYPQFVNVRLRTFQMFNEEVRVYDIGESALPCPVWRGGG